MNEYRTITRLLTLAASLAIAVAGAAWADPDEAWLAHAPVPAGVRPLLVIVLDTSAAMERRILTAEPYDSGTDYAPAVDAAKRCVALVGCIVEIDDKADLAVGSTKMAFKLADEQQRKDVIAYINKFSEKK